MKQVNNYSERGSSVPWWNRIAKYIKRGTKPLQRSNPSFHRFGNAHPRPTTKDSFYNLPIGSRPNVIIAALVLSLAASWPTSMLGQGVSPQWPGVGAISGSNHTKDYLIKNCLYNPTKELTLDGNLNDWLTFGRYYPSDAYDAPGAHNSIDFLDAWMAHDANYLYIAYTSNGHIALNQTENIYIDIDFNQSTGYVVGALGAEYLLQGNRFYRYKGNGQSFDWELVGTAETGVYGCQVEMRIPRAWIANALKLRFVMQADNISAGGTINDYFPDNGFQSALLGGSYFCYRFQSAKEIHNIAPVASSTVWNTLVNQPVQIIIHKFDANGDPLTFHFVSNVAHGTLTPDGPDAFIYTPNPGFVGTDSFTFFVHDGLVASAHATITIHVNPLPTPPPGSVLCISNPTKGGIKVNGFLHEWGGFNSFGIDPDDPDDHINRVDWRQAWMAHTPNTLYLAYENGSAIGSDFNWGFMVYLDTDTEPLTGFRGGSDEYAIGADYLIQSRHIFRYTGSGTDWSWVYVGTVTSGIHNQFVEMSIPRAFIGNPAKMHVIFAGMNKAFPGGSGIDHYPDDAVTNRSCFCYDLTTVAKLGIPRQTSNNASSVTVPTDVSYQTTDILFKAPKAKQSRSLITSKEDSLSISLDWAAETGAPMTIQYSTNLNQWNDILVYETQNGNTAFVADDLNGLSNAFFRAVSPGKSSESVSAE